MSTLSLQRGDNTPNLDGENDLQPEVETTLVRELGKKPKKTKKRDANGRYAKKETKSTEE